MWNYIYYIAYLNHKDENDYNGNESYISNKVKGDDISWLPIKRYLIDIILELDLLKKRLMKI